MKYNREYVERIMIKSCFDNPLLWSNLKPWWFDGKLSTDISWRVRKFKSTHGYEPDVETCLTLLDDYDLEHVRLWLDVKPIETKDRNILISLFKGQAMLFEILLNHFGKKPVDEKTLGELKGLVPYFKKHLEDHDHNVDELKKLLNIIIKYYDKLK